MNNNAEEKLIFRTNDLSAEEFVKLCEEYKKVKKKEDDLWETKYLPLLKSLAEGTSS